MDFSFVLIGLCFMTLKCAAGDDDLEIQRRRPGPIKPPPITPKVPPVMPPHQPQPQPQPAHVKEAHPSFDPDRDFSPVRDPNAKFIQANSTAEVEALLKDAGDRLVILVFFAEPRNSCKTMQPFLEELAGEYPDVVIVKVDIDNYDLRYTLMQYKINNIKSMPIYVFLRRYKELNRLSGTDKVKLKEYLLYFS